MDECKSLNPGPWSSQFLETEVFHALLLGHLRATHVVERCRLTL